MVKKDTTGPDILKLAIGALAGFSIGWILSHQKSNVKKKLPEKKIKSLQILPNIKLERKDKVYHFHHWMVLSSFYFPLLIKKGNFLKHKFLHGVVLGGIVQGLSFKDRFNIIYKKTQEAVNSIPKKIEEFEKKSSSEKLTHELGK